MGYKDHRINLKCPTSIPTVCTYALTTAYSTHLLAFVFVLFKGTQKSVLRIGAVLVEIGSTYCRTVVLRSTHSFCFPCAACEIVIFILEQMWSNSVCPLAWWPRSHFCQPLLASIHCYSSIRRLVYALRFFQDTTSTQVKDTEPKLTI